MSDARDEHADRIARGIVRVREGHGANCSSIGSVIDTLFATAAIGGALFTAIAAAMTKEKVTVVGSNAVADADADANADADADAAADADADAAPAPDPPKAP